MENKLHQFFNQNEFDIHEPHSGHFDRFEKKLKGNKSQKRISWKWMSVAAAVILCIGYGMGTLNQNTTQDLSSISPEMAETQNFFVSAIKANLVDLEKNRNLDTEKIVESALDELENLEDQYQLFVKELKTTGQHRKVINAMINNYQQRLEILKNALQQIETVKSNKNLEDEIYI